MIWSFFKMISLTTKFVMLILLCFKILTHKHVHEGSGVRVEVGSHMGVGEWGTCAWGGVVAGWKWVVTWAWGACAWGGGGWE